MRRFFWLVVAAGAAGWIVSLRQRLHVAQLRGDMYRDFASRLDRQIVERGERGR
jgi:hypothetical protein